MTNDPGQLRKISKVLGAFPRQRVCCSHIAQLEKMKAFDFDDWRQRYMGWMNHNKTRVMDFFRRQDRDHDGKVTRQEFIDGILASSEYCALQVRGYSA